jgi:hypothetical protein
MRERSPRSDRRAASVVLPLTRSRAAKRTEQLARLVYELLDAHLDTELLLRDGSSELWVDAHRDYLRHLQRRGREILAQTIAPPADGDG